MKNLHTFYLSLIVALFSVNVLFAQTESEPPIGLCASSEILHNYHLAHPAESTRYELMMDSLQLDFENSQQQNSNYKVAAITYSIPVVFHILYNNTTVPPTDAQVVNALANLNKDFNKQNTDAFLISSLFSGIHTTSDIVFVLAKQDPNGNCTNGIIRHNDPTPSINIDNAMLASEYAYSGSGVNRWPTNKYLNIYVVNCVTGTIGGTYYSCSSSLQIGGYSFKPGSFATNAAQDVAVMRYADVKTNTRVMTHEIGHWLGLLHTWGSAPNPNVTCGDDGISDTPITKGDAPGSCPSSGSNPCVSSNKKNVENFMNYADCKRMFTAVQVAKMRNTLISTVSGRSNLKSSGNHLVTLTQPSGAPIVSVASNTSICSGTTIKLTASGAGTGGTYNWSTGANTSTINVTPTTTKIYTVTGTKLSNGCSDVTTVTVTVKATPIVASTSQTICNGSSATLVASGASTYTWSTGVSSKSLTTSPSITTIYTVTGTSTNGCKDLSTGKVTIKATPTVAATSQTICNGSSATLVASGASTYTWSTGVSSKSLTTSPSITTMYTVTGTSANGCKDISTGKITVKATPTVAATSQTICNGSSATLVASGASTYTWSTGVSSKSLTTSPSITTTYTVTGTSTNGCKDISTGKITVKATPTVAATSQTICNGSSATLVASGASTYTWSTGVSSKSLTTSPSITITYTVTGTSANGCKDLSTGKVTVLNNPTTPTVSANGMNLISNLPTGNQWYYNGTAITGATTQTYNATQAGTYYVVVTNSNGCLSANSNTVSIVTTDIDAFDYTDKLLILKPNPADGYITLSVNEQLSAFNYVIYASNGQLVKEAKVQGITETVDVSDFSSGVYFIIVTTNNKQFKTRFIKN